MILIYQKCAIVPLLRRRRTEVSHNDINNNYDNDNNNNDNNKNNNNDNNNNNNNNSLEAKYVGGTSELEESPRAKQRYSHMLQKLLVIFCLLRPIIEIT